MGVGLSALLAFEFDTQVLIAPLLGNNPGTIDPRGIVAHVLCMATSEIGNPVALLVLVVIDNFLFHVPEPGMRSAIVYIGILAPGEMEHQPVPFLIS